MSESSPDLEKEVAALKEDVNRLRADIANLTEALKAAAGGYAEEARARAQEQAEAAKAKAQEQIDAVVNAGREEISALGERVAERPLASLLTAAGIGFVVAKLLDLGGRR